MKVHYALLIKAAIFGLAKRNSVKIHDRSLRILAVEISHTYCMEKYDRYF